MIALSTVIVLAALAAVPLAWLLPDRRGIDAVAVLGLAVLVAISPPSAAWMAAAMVLAPAGMAWAERAGRKGAFAALWTAVLLGAFVAAQLAPGFVWIGGAFFTLRQIHVIGDWWMGRLAVPSVSALLRYQLFLPALFVGPVHRIQNFERECTRRRWDREQFFAGAERVLLGAFSAEVLGNSLQFLREIKRLLLTLFGGSSAASAEPGAAAELPLLDRVGNLHPFLRDWAISAFDWIELFFTFAGLTAMALGIAAMMGIRLEENFNQPWRARNLLDFWNRWHMSLTSWVQDYVYRPVMALTRNPLAGLLAAMLVIGLWHELSAYYVLWALWQSLGIVLNRLAGPVLGRIFPQTALRIMAPFAILGWLALARPVIIRLPELFG